MHSIMSICRVDYVAVACRPHQARDAVAISVLDFRAVFQENGDHIGLAGTGRRNEGGATRFVPGANFCASLQKPGKDLGI